MGDGETKVDTLQGQSSALLKEAYGLLYYLRSNTIGEEPKAAAEDAPHIANPIDDAMNKMQETRKVLEEIRAVLASSVIEKLK